MKRFIADTVGQLVWWVVIRLPYSKRWLKILWWIAENESCNPYETK